MENPDITLLDYFASKALIGYIDIWPPKEAAEKSYEYAKSMLEERKKHITPLKNKG